MNATVTVLSKFFSVEVLAKLLLGNFRRAIRRLAMDVMTVVVEVKHDHRNVQDRSQIHERGSLDGSKSLLTM